MFLWLLQRNVSLTVRDCIGVLTGHTSLVGQLQLRYPLLVTGGPDGSIRVWNVKEMRGIHHLSGHDNSVTSLQFDDQRIVSGGSDGLTKIWDLETGHFIREMTDQAESVFRVAFKDDVVVVVSQREGTSCMEVISFWPQDRNLSRTTDLEHDQR